MAAQIAAAGKLDKSYVSRVLNNQKPPSPHFFRALRRVLKRLVREHPELLLVIRAEHPDLLPGDRA
jgi:transcriptional regulator with XRE-family HTH domain